ncbi:MAG TPA: CarD family transcriptional regulator [Patescibacteria group bacterium]|nr:CarD family transcriptional regulator [Patescibacteria group bacterium]
MFNMGDKVVYPRHGAGIIDGIEEKQVLGEKCKYYVIRIALGDMRVMVPLDKMEALGIRYITPKDKIDDIYNILSGETSYMCKNWSKRYRGNESKIRNGDIFGIAEIVKNLTVIDREKKLSTGEKRMLESANQLLVSELMLMLDEPIDKVEEIIQGLIR